MSFKYSFQIEDNDYYEYNRFHIYNNPSTKHTMLIARILFPVFILIMSFSFGQINQAVSFVYYGMFIIMALAVFIFYNQIINYSLKRNIKKVKKTGKLHYDSEITYEFLNDLFTEKTNDIESVIKYSMIEKILPGTNAFYLYINVQSAYILPFRVFKNEEEKKEFLYFRLAEKNN